MKKLIAAILLGVMLLGVGCTPKESDENSGQNNPAGQQGERQQSVDDLLGE